MRLVLDTNVLIAAFISRGVCNELLEHCVLYHEVVLSEFILAELREKLTEKFTFTLREADAVVRLLMSRSEIVSAPPLAAPVSRDPDDDNIISTAATGRCDCIITGDRDLLELEKVDDIAVVSPADFWRFEGT